MLHESRRVDRAAMGLLSVSTVGILWTVGEAFSPDTLEHVRDNDPRAALLPAHRYCTKGAEVMYGLPAASAQKTLTGNFAHGVCGAAARLSSKPCAKSGR